MRYFRPESSSTLKPVFGPLETALIRSSPGTPIFPLTLEVFSSFGLTYVWEPLPASRCSDVFDLESFRIHQHPDQL